MSEGNSSRFTYYSSFIPSLRAGPHHQGASYRITKEQWEALNELSISIEPPAQNELFVSGDHYLLYLTLRKMGFRPPSDAMEIYRMAKQILAEGWDE